jgi:hypothetical protein
MQKKIRTEQQAQNLTISEKLFVLAELIFCFDLFNFMLNKVTGLIPDEVNF